MSDRMILNKHFSHHLQRGVKLCSAIRQGVFTALTRPGGRKFVLKHRRQRSPSRTSRDFQCCYACGISAKKDPFWWAFFGEKSLMLVTNWVFPLPSKNHHQDCYVFSRGSQHKPTHLPLASWEEKQPKFQTHRNFQAMSTF